MLLIDLESTDYLHFIEIQKKIINRKITAGFDDVLLLMEHPPTVTLGLRGSLSNLTIDQDQLTKLGISVYFVDRGGEATYHGPGQLVAYPLLDLKRLKISVKDYVFNLEETILVALQKLGLRAFRQKGKPGVWTGEQDKIASIGIRIQRRITSHGFSLNVDLKKDPTLFMICCGNPGIRMVSVNQLLTAPVRPARLRQIIADCFSEVFKVNLVPLPLEQVLIANTR